MRKAISSKQLASLSLCLSLALVLGYVESLIVILPQIPGIKLGLPNLIVLLLLTDKEYGLKSAAIVNIIRIIMSALLFGSIISFLYAITAGTVSMLVMWLTLKVKKLGISGVSVIGGVTHNIFQLLMAGILTKAVAVYYYLPILLIFGAICGMISGVIALNVRKYLKSGKK